MSESLGGVVARRGVFLVFTTIVVSSAKLSEKNKRHRNCDRRASIYTDN
jgi:hypothetical protein